MSQTIGGSDTTTSTATTAVTTTDTERPGRPADWAAVSAVAQ